MWRGCELALICKQRSFVATKLHLKRFYFERAYESLHIHSAAHDKTEMRNATEGHTRDNREDLFQNYCSDEFDV